MSDSSFNREQIEVIEELINISYGLATSVLADTMGAYSKMSVPEIVVCSVGELQSKIKDFVVSNKDYLVTVQQFINDFEGESVFLIDVESAVNVIKSFFGEDEELSEEEIKGCISEITNIVTSACMGKFAEQLESDIYFNAPSTQIRKPEDVVDYEHLSAYYKVISVRTVFEFKDENIFGNLYLLFKEDSFQRLSESITKILEDF